MRKRERNYRKMTKKQRESTRESETVGDDRIEMHKRSGRARRKDKRGIMQKRC